MNENFVAAITPPDNQARPALWFLFHRFDMLVFLDEASGAARLPCVVNPASLNLADFMVTRQHYFGYLQDAARTHCFAAELIATADSPALPPGMALLDLRRLFGRLAEASIWLAGRAVQLVDWDRTHQFCGRCGAPTHTAPNERVKQCPNCQHTSYPRLSPAMIVRVTREGANGRPEILLARNRRAKIPMYSVLAGFVEPGETLETCVRREVGEEVGLTVKNIRYFGSQPWPFPNSLMIAFTAEYAGGDLRLEETELVDAGWYSADNLPPYPPALSIAHRLIADFIQQQAGIRR
ncbi:MAG: NAD(+) diphosphatase [Chloroflexi bacterium]|nr:NAD(+) diphosphatase [Chloroflexota bacterium]